jgi:hypothetical protein
MSDYPKTDKAIALFWGVKIRTLYRWKGSGAPITNHKEMLTWLAGRKRLPHAVLAKIELPGDKNVSSPANGGTPGAASALKRLETSELAAFDRLQLALGRGNPLEIRECRENWLKISESLRRFDLLVEQNRRDAGELIPAIELEKFIHSFITFMEVSTTLACETITNELIGRKEEEIYPIIRQLCTASIYEACLGYVGAGGEGAPDPRLVVHAKRVIQERFGWHFRSQEAA